MKIMSGLPINNIKFHQLQIVRNTVMAEQFRADPDEFTIFGLDEYLSLMVRILELLNPECVVERIAGESNPDYLLSPSWGIRYDQVLKKFEKLLAREDSWQGKRFTP
jgi:radical SAM superfamily enzyme